MKAALIYSITSSIFTKEYELEIRRELYKIHGEAGKQYPDGYRFGWIAFDRFNKMKSVLFDCHPPKGAHYHIDGEQPGTSFEWTGLNDATTLFWMKVWEHFGDRIEGDEK